jgi:hypothetical protein
MSGSSGIKDSFGGVTDFGIVVKEALGLRIGIRVILSNMQLFHFSRILRD